MTTKDLQRLHDKFYRFHLAAQTNAAKAHEKGEQAASTYHSGRSTAWEDAVDELRELYPTLTKRKTPRNRWKGLDD